MTIPVTITLGPIHLPPQLLHMVFETLGMVFGYQYFVSLRKRRGDAINDDNRVWILIGATAGALVGSRLLGSLEDPAAFFDPKTPLLYYYTSKTIVGGLLGGLAGVEITKKIIGVATSSGDLFTFPLILAMMTGRIGCFCNGILEPTFGIESGLPWAMDLGDGLRRHPVALYEIAFLALLWLALRLVESRTARRNGLRFQLFMLAYLAFRFAVEFIKPHINVPGIGLSSIQIACVLGWGYYGILWGKRLFYSQKSM